MLNTLLLVLLAGLSMPVFAADLEQKSEQQSVDKVYFVLEQEKQIIDFPIPQHGKYSRKAAHVMHVSNKEMSRWRPATKIPIAIQAIRDCINPVFMQPNCYSEKGFRIAENRFNTSLKHTIKLVNGLPKAEAPRRTSDPVRSSQHVALQTKSGSF